MIDPAHPRVSPEAPSRTTRADAAPQKDCRCFTPIDGDPARRPKGLGRLALAAAWDGDDLEAINRKSVAGRPERLSSERLRQHGRSSFHPELIERRIATAARALAGLALAGSVVLAAASGILFRVPSPGASPPAVAARNGLIPPSTAALTPAESLAATREALAALTKFLQADTAGERRAAIATTDRLPASLEIDGIVTSLQGARLEQPGRAQHLSAGLSDVVLVPLTDGNGLPRIAAVVRRSDHWTVDWRSVFTPEPVEWRDLVAGAAPAAPSLWRVLLSRTTDGSWSIARPGSTNEPLTAEMAPGSRVAAELEAAWSDRGGSPLPADVYLTADSSRRLNIVDWTKDKWSL